MLQIGNTLVSLDIIEQKFKCNLKECKGACCLHGDSGAPLEENEKEELKNNFSRVKAYLPQKNVPKGTKHPRYFDSSSRGV